MQFYAPQIDYLVKRWNEMTIRRYLRLWRYGTLNFRSTKGRVGWCGSRRREQKIFISASTKKCGEHWSRFLSCRARLGIAPYEAEYNEIASWFMIQYQWHPMLLKKNAFTLLFDCFTKVLFETESYDAIGC